MSGALLQCGARQELVPWVSYSLKGAKETQAGLHLVPAFSVPEEGHSTVQPPMGASAPIRCRLPASEAPDEGSTPSECCNRTRFVRPPTACQRRSSAAGPAEYPPYLGSWPSHCQWCQRPRIQGDGFSCQGLHEDLHASPHAKH